MARILVIGGGELRSAPAMTIALPDTTLIHATCKVPDTRVYMAVVPSWLRFNFAILARFTKWFRFARRPLAWLLEWQMIVLRAWLLRGIETRVELTAIADRGRPSERSCALSFVDGQTATALGVAAAVHAWTRAGERRPGLFGVADVLSLDDLLRGLDDLEQPPALRWSDDLR